MCVCVCICYAESKSFILLHDAQCVCARARACVCKCVCVHVCACVWCVHYVGEHVVRFGCVLNVQCGYCMCSSCVCPPSLYRHTVLCRYLNEID